MTVKFYLSFIISFISEIIFFELFIKCNIFFFSYGFDPSTLSPPTHEGDFFYIKYPKPQSQPANTLNLKNQNEVINIKEQAFSKHTDSCKKFIPNIQNTFRVQKPKVTKPMGVDDGFKGEEASCGTSVVEVAHQILTQNKNISSLTRVDTEGNLAPPSSYLKSRRNSKSLPASPLTSPGGSPLTKRKGNSQFQNRLFDLNFKSGENSLCGSDDAIDNNKSGSSWILSSLFGAKEVKESGKETTREKSLILAEKDFNPVVKFKEDGSKSTKQAVDTTVAVDVRISPSAGSSKGPSFFKSKPYLRDLNLLTPSSM